MEYYPFPSIRDGVQSSDPAERLASTIKIRELVSLQDDDDLSAVKHVVEQGCVPHLIESLSTTGNAGLQCEAAWALTNICFGEYAEVVLAGGALTIFEALLRSTSTHISVREQIIWACGNIAATSVQARDRVLAANILKPVLKLLSGQYHGFSFSSNKNPDHDIWIPNPAQKEMTRIASWALSVFLRGRPSPSPELVEKALPMVRRLVRSNDTDVLKAILWALSDLSRGPPSRKHDKINLVLRLGICPRLVSLLDHSNRKVVSPVLTCVRSITSGTGRQASRVVKHGVLKGLYKVLVKYGRTEGGADGVRVLLQEKAARSVSNILKTGTSWTIQKVMDAGLFEPLIDGLGSSVRNVRSASAAAIDYAVTRGTQHVPDLVQMGILPPVVELLGDDDNDVAIKMHSLSALNSVIQSGILFAGAVKEAGGIVQIRKLVHSRSRVIMRKAFALCGALDCEAATIIQCSWRVKVAHQTKEANAAAARRGQQQAVPSDEDEKAESKTKSKPRYGNMLSTLFEAASSTSDLMDHLLVDKTQHLNNKNTEACVEELEKTGKEGDEEKKMICEKENQQQPQPLFANIGWQEIISGAFLHGPGRSLRDAPPQPGRKVVAIAEPALPMVTTMVSGPSFSFFGAGEQASPASASASSEEDTDTKVMEDEDEDEEKEQAAMSEKQKKEAGLRWFRQCAKDGLRTAPQVKPMKKGRGAKPSKGPET